MGVPVSAAVPMMAEAMPTKVAIYIHVLLAPHLENQSEWKIKLRT